MDHSETIREMSERRQGGIPQTLSPHAAELARLSGDFGGDDQRRVPVARQAKRAFANGGLNTSNEFFADDSQAGLDKRLAQMQGMNAAPVQQPVAAAPIPGADVTGTLPGQTGYNPSARPDATGTLPGQAGYSPAPDRTSDLISKINGAGTRTERAAYGAALDGMLKKDPTLMSSSDLESAMRGAGTRTARGALGQAMAGQMIRGYAQGGKIKGPGTATSDSIPAKTQTGEDILVSNGERVLSVAQDQALQRIAELLNYASVDAMLEALTGKPVGPTVKSGKRAAAGGGQFGNETAETSLSPLNGQTTRAGNYPSKLEQLLTGAQVVPAAPNVQRGDVGPSQLAQSVAADMARHRGPAPVVDYSNEGRSVPHPISVPANRASQPGAQILGAEPIDSMKPMDLTTKDIAPGGYIDRGNGILAQRGQNGQLSVTNVGTGDLTDPKKRAVDDSASALIDQKNSNYDPYKQYENMLRIRMMSDATDPTITDPNVVANARAGLAILNAGRQGEASAELHSAQAGQAKALTAQTQQMEALRGKLLDPKTSDEERTRLLQTVMAISGHQRQTPYQIHDVEIPIDPAQPLLGHRKEPRLFDPTKGSLTAFQSQPQATDAMSQAKAAIARGADRKAVNARLRQLGLPEIK